MCNTRYKTVTNNETCFAHYIDGANLFTILRKTALKYVILFVHKWYVQNIIQNLDQNWIMLCAILYKTQHNKDHNKTEQNYAQICAINVQITCTNWENHDDVQSFVMQTFVQIIQPNLCKLCNIVK